MLSRRLGGRREEEDTGARQRGLFGSVLGAVTSAAGGGGEHEEDGGAEGEQEEEEAEEEEEVVSLKYTGGISEVREKPGSVVSG